MSGNGVSALRCQACGAMSESQARFCGACGKPLKGSARSWWRRTALFGGLAAVVAGAAITVWFSVLSPGSSPQGSGPYPEDEFRNGEVVALRPLDHAAGTRAYLRAEGEPLVRFHGASAPLAELSFDDAAVSAQQCLDIAEQRLATVTAVPRDLLEFAADVPDMATAELLANDVLAKVHLLAACDEGDSQLVALRQEQVRFTHTVVARRFAQLDLNLEVSP